MQWDRSTKTLLNGIGKTYGIYTTGDCDFPVKQRKEDFATYLEDLNFPPGTQFTNAQSNQHHFNLCIKNADSSVRNYNHLQSMIFFYNYLIKAAAKVPSLAVQLQTIAINDCIGAYNTVKAFYQEWEGPEVIGR